MDVSQHAGALITTVAYISMYYAFVVHGLRVKTALRREYKARGEVFDRYFGQDRRLLAADRIQLNTLEHMPPFLVLLWLNSVFVGPIGTTIAGAMYVVARASYPFMIGPELRGGIRPRVYVATFVGYAVIAYYAVALVWALSTG